MALRSLPLFLLALVALRSLLLGFDAAAFVGAPGSSLTAARSLRRAAAQACDEAGPTSRTIQPPEANCFVEQAAADCISHGCSVDEIEKIQAKLQHDEGRIRDKIDMLQVARDEYDADLSQDIGMLRLALSRIHSLSTELQAMLGIQNSAFTKDFAAYLAFGSLKTGGFLNLKGPAVEA
eukprot:TRINITY_DN64165_c0_g1_i1.p2 TRINITY_DN64165_c0_g1~~TRINITY_DN64165_c0_g1_i1.p2  ORF type:complete len:179 (+),score=41.94 TRINITY_DN64165_c0_g1_i1:55-591(+)